MIFQWMPAGGGGAILASLWLSNPMTVALLRPDFVPNYDTQDVWTDVASGEVAAGNGYSTGGILLTGKAAPYNAGADKFDFQANDVQWGPPATFDAGFAVVYDNSGSKPLWALADFQGTKSVSTGTFVVDFQTAGVLYVGLAA